MAVVVSCSKFHIDFVAAYSGVLLSYFQFSVLFYHFSVAKYLFLFFRSLTVKLANS
jgi:hypothetical protein